MVYSGKLIPKKLKEEILVFIRNQNIISVAERGVATIVESFNGTGAQFSFDISNINIKNVRSITVDGAIQAYGDDYDVDYRDANPGRITFIVAPPVGVNNVVITYDYGDGDKLFPDWPREDLSILSYPRIGFDIRVETGRLCIGANAPRWSEVNVIFKIYSKDLKTVESMVADIRDAFVTNAQTFYYFSFITPKRISEMEIKANRKGAITGRKLELLIPKTAIIEN